MVQLLSKFGVVCLLFLFCTSFAQDKNESVYNPKDYKDGAQFHRFYKRRTAVAKWQINQLKNGALVVRLRTNQKQIDGLKKMGKADLATQMEYQTMAVNKNIVLAFTKYYTFSKVYFIFSQSSDSLLNGKRKGIFVDTNLVVDPQLELKEKFYLIAEKDNVYNSSIGFVKEDTARFVKEMGNASTEAAMVIKNKFGHQLKDPFPHFVKNKSTVVGTKFVNVRVGDVNVPVELEKKQRVERHYAYVATLNKYLLGFYSESKDYEVTDPDVKPFLY